MATLLVQQHTERRNLKTEHINTYLLGYIFCGGEISLQNYIEIVYRSKRQHNNNDVNDR